MMLSEIESNLREENECIKELFNFNGSQSQLQHVKELFSNFIKNSKNDSKCFIELLKHYSQYRPHQHDVSKELVECVYSSFPKQIKEIQKNIKTQTLFILRFIIFPEKFPINGNKEENEMLLLLQRDDLEGFISFLSKNPTIDITKKQKLEEGGFYFYLFDLRRFISLD